MNYAQLNSMDIVNGEGIRVSLFVSGCNFHCPDCFNKEAQSFTYGTKYTQKTREKILSLVNNPHIKGLSLLGGDPLCQAKEDLQELLVLIHKVKSLGKTVWLWSGYTWDELHNSVSKEKGKRLDEVFLKLAIVQSCDVFVDGPFKIAEKDLGLAFRGSTNQRVIDVKKSIDLLEETGSAENVALYKE